MTVVVSWAPHGTCLSRCSRSRAMALALVSPGARRMVARARVTIRLAPGDTSANAIARLREHLDKHVPWGAQLTTTVIDAGEPTVLPAAGPAYAAARSALAEAWGVAPVDMGCG